MGTNSCGLKSQPGQPLCVQEDWMHTHTSSATLSLFLLLPLPDHPPPVANSPLAPASPALLANCQPAMHTDPMSFIQRSRYRLSLSSKMKHAHTQWPTQLQRTLNTYIYVLCPTCRGQQHACRLRCCSCRLQTAGVHCTLKFLSDQALCASGHSHITQVGTHHTLAKHQCGCAYMGG
jgi:hypothetical protein